MTNDLKNTDHTLAARVAALELLLQQLVLHIEMEPRLSAGGLHNWLELVTGRMAETGSAAPADVAALRDLAAKVCA